MGEGEGNRSLVRDRGREDGVMEMVSKRKAGS